MKEFSPVVDRSYLFVCSLVCVDNTYKHRVLKLTMKSEQVSFQVADALNQPFPDGKFDLVWSMESGEHMPDKLKVLV